MNEPPAAIDATDATDPRAPADPDEQVGGHCRSCGEYGLGAYDGPCGGLYDWITGHVGCPRPSTERPR
ncbi:hypothetical protein ACFQ6N_04705 [Kitasatospora sp. NPDC056446]|uniref:hypothetical protein n=1 Tax=Kitasatospora sp. NPDC056446 TaxID=3345819 RepID=UPI0036C5D003